MASCAGCYALGTSPGATAHRRLLETPSGGVKYTPFDYSFNYTAAYEADAKKAATMPTDSNPPDPLQPCYNELSGVGSPAGGNFYMTATNKCPNDTFSVSLVYFPRNSSYVTALDGATGPIRGIVKHQWVSAYLTNFNWSIVVLRESDGKIITPKGIKPDGTWYDISETGKKVCQLFALGVTPLKFAYFRGKASSDGLKMTMDDFGSQKIRKALYENWKSSKGGIDCEKYVDPEAGPFGPKFGKLVTAYKPGSCRFGIDDCSS